MLLAYIFVPLLGAAIMPVLRKIWSKGAGYVAILVTVYQIIITGWIAYQDLVLNNSLTVERWILGQALALQVDGLSLVALLAIGLVGLVTVAFSIRYPFDEDRRPGYYALVLLAVTGMNGLVMATDLFSLYVFLEIVSVTSFILIAYQYDVFGIEGAFKYMMLSAVATVFLLVAIALLFAITGGVSFNELSAGIKGGPVATLSFAFIFFALALKAGMIPFHGWLPDAYTSAPAYGIHSPGGNRHQNCRSLYHDQSVYGHLRVKSNVSEFVNVHWRYFHSSGSLFRVRPKRFQTDAGLFEHQSNRVYYDGICHRNATRINWGGISFF